MAQRGAGLSILALPDDIIYEIVSYCDRQSLGRLACCCRRLNWLSCQDCVWLRLMKSLPTKIASRGEFRQIQMKEQCQLARNLTEGFFRDNKQIQYQVKQLPWMQLDRNIVWISNKNVIECYQQKPNGNLQKISRKAFRTDELRSDVTRFKTNSNFIVCGSRNGGIFGFSCHSGDLLLKMSGCHTSDVHDVDFYDETIVSGSRDDTIKVWSMNESDDDMLKYTIPAQDRVWSIAINPNGNSFASGSAGCNHIPPLRLWDLESGILLGNLGSNYKNGAGVLDMQFENPYVLLTGGYDTYIRMWDLRTSYSECVCRWEEPFDSTIYTVRSDGQNSIFGGTSRHGVVQLWDKRKSSPVQHYFVGRVHNSSSSPVYSLAFNPRYMYVALDKGVHLIDFTDPG